MSLWEHLAAAGVAGAVLTAWTLSPPARWLRRRKRLGGR